MRRYTVGGFIIGPKLPTETLPLRNGELRRVRPGEIFPRGRPRFPRISAEDAEGRPVDHFSVTPGDILVHSSWIFRYRVEAEDEELAVQLVEETLLPPLLSAVSPIGSSWSA